MAGIMPNEKFQYVPPMTDNNPYVYQRPPIFMNPPNDKVTPYYPPATQFLNPPNDKVVPYVPATQQKATKKKVVQQPQQAAKAQAATTPKGKDMQQLRDSLLKEQQRQQLLRNLFMFRIQPDANPIQNAA